MKHAPLTALLCVALTLCPAEHARAQTLVSLELGGSQVSPPSGVDGDPGRFFVVGARASRFSVEGSGMSAMLLVGRSLDSATGGNFVSGGLDGALMHGLGGGWSLGGDARLFGFEVDAPFRYRAWALEGGPAIRYRGRRAYARVAGTAGAARSRVEVRRRTGGAVRTVEDELWRYGGGAELLLGSPRAMAGVAVGVHETAGGRYETGGIRVLVSRGGGAAELRLDVWETPLGRETTGGLTFTVPLAGVWDVRGFLGRSEPDPLTLAQPSGASGGLLVGRRLYESTAFPRSTPLHEVVSRSADGATVRIQLRAPAATERVELMGDFTLWEPVAMSRAGDAWEVSIEVPVGTHHFGFLVDGDWYVPDGAPDIVPDEWGRVNATMVIER